MKIFDNKLILDEIILTKLFEQSSQVLFINPASLSVLVSNVTCELLKIYNQCNTPKKNKEFKG